MWSTEVTRTGPGTCEQVWRAWSDVDRWSSWNADVVRATLDGPFAAGSTVTMQLADGAVVPLLLAEAVPGRGFVDEARLDGVVVRTEHRAEPAGEQVRVTYRLTVDREPAAEVPDEVLAEVGAGISADFGDVVEALLATAGAGAGAATADERGV